MTSIDSNLTNNIEYTNVKNPNFKEKITKIKTDEKDNLLKVNKENGDVTIFSYKEFPENINNTIIEPNIKIFIDNGEDDLFTTEKEIQQFITDIRKSGIKYDPTSHLSDLRNKIENLKRKSDDEINVRNLYYRVEKLLDDLKYATEKKDYHKMIEISKNLKNIGRALYLNFPIYIPEERAWYKLDRSNILLGQKFGEVSYL